MQTVTRFPISQYIFPQRNMACRSKVLKDFISCKFAGVFSCVILLKAKASHKWLSLLYILTVIYQYLDLVNTTQGFHKSPLCTDSVTKLQLCVCSRRLLPEGSTTSDHQLSNYQHHHHRGPLTQETMHPNRGPEHPVSSRRFLLRRRAQRRRQITCLHVRICHKNILI